MASVGSFYRKHSGHWARHYGGKQKPSFHLRIRYAIELARRLKARRVLDAGCGTGHLIEALTKAGIPCDGIDLSQDMLAEARARLGPDSRLVRGNLERLSNYPSGRFDLITAFGVFVHAINEKKVLDNFRRKLSPNGRLFISFRNPLFSIFTLNEHTQSFYEDLLESSPVSAADKRRALDYFKTSCRNRYVSRVKARGFDRDFAKTFSKFHNPLEISALFARSGLAVADLLYLNMHPLPPQVMEKAGARDRAAAVMEKRLSRSWQGMFLASSYIVEARKA